MPSDPADAQAVRDWNGLIKAFLSHGTTAPKYLKAVLTAEPDFAMGHAVRGLFSMMMGRREIIEVGHQANTTVQEKLRLGGANRHETLWCEALGIWVSGSAIRALLGRSNGWSPQRRNVVGYTWPEMLRFHQIETLVGVLMTTGIILGGLSLWLLLIALSLVGAVILSKLS
ncbi:MULTISPECIES: hypothetical protein [Nereida]|uniref:Glucosyltransferase MdoH n=1 Tax=Nereida ignava TaxID=282199 RepID=A0A0U1NKF1_9RHOB|nr:hypothetical protein [Nereida ignava]CRK75202.1 glucosyltransferase MdoH [Nereida ignava]SFI98384.1 hypothetical protein SAMN02745667_00067 [Nereida ignava DSM 16309]